LNAESKKLKAYLELCGFDSRHFLHNRIFPVVQKIILKID